MATSNKISIPMIIGFVGVCLAAPFFNAFLSLLATVVLCIRILMYVIQAAVTSDQRRSTAIGFLVPALAYIGCVWHFDEFRGHSHSRLPTTRILYTISASPSADNEPTSSAEFRERRAAESNAVAFIVLGHYLIAYAAGMCGLAYASGLTQSTLYSTTTTKGISG